MSSLRASCGGRRERKSRGGVVPRNALGSLTGRGCGGRKGTTLAGEFGARVSCESQVPPRRLSGRAHGCTPVTTRDFVGCVRLVKEK